MKNSEEGRKIILIICEGKADRIAYQIFSIFNDANKAPDKNKPIIHIIFTNGDKLTYSERYEDGSVKYFNEKDCMDIIELSVRDELDKYVSREKLKLADFDRVLFITDMDGVYIDDESIVDYNDSCVDPYYSDDFIYTEHRNRIVYRNARKRKNLEYLLEAGSIRLSTYHEKAVLPLYVYYVSCNLDHIMVNDRNNYEKQSPAKVWKKRVAAYGNRQHIYEYFDSLCVTDKNYEETWNYISEKRTVKSLSRCSNAVLILNYLDYYVKKREKERA